MDRSLSSSQRLGIRTTSRAGCLYHRAMMSWQQPLENILMSAYAWKVRPSVVTVEFYSCPRLLELSITFAFLQIGYGWWRSPVAHLHGVQEVAGSNPVHPTTSAVASAWRTL